MSPENTSQKLNNPGITDEEKRRKHAEAQRKYRERYFVSTPNWRELTVCVCQKSRSNPREGPREDEQVRAHR
jgi:hypothetical protein